MGQAKKRGTFEQRQALAMERNKEIEIAYEEVMSDIRKRETAMYDEVERKLKDAHDDIDYFLLTQANSFAIDEKRFVNDPEKNLVREDIAVIRVEENAFLVIHAFDFNTAETKHRYVRNEEGVYVEENPPTPIGRKPFTPTREQLTYLIGANLRDKAISKMQHSETVPEMLELASITSDEIDTVLDEDPVTLAETLFDSGSTENAQIVSSEYARGEHPAISYMDDSPFAPVSSEEDVANHVEA